MGNGRSRLNFDIGSAEGIKTVKAVEPVDVFLAAGVTDGEGKKSNRLLFRFKGSKTFYFLFPKGSEEAMKPAAGWLQEIMEQQTADYINDEPLPEDPVTDVPTGDPMEA
jgi:hypothetical protein